MQCTLLRNTKESTSDWISFCFCGQLLTIINFWTKLLCSLLLFNRWTPASVYSRKKKLVEFKLILHCLYLTLFLWKWCLTKFCLVFLSSLSFSISQFGDIYQEDYFVNYMKSDVQIVKDLPPHLQSLDLEAIGSQVSAWTVPLNFETLLVLQIPLLKPGFPLFERRKKGFPYRFHCPPFITDDW